MISTYVQWNGARVSTAATQAAALGVNMAAARLEALAAPLTPYLEGDLDLSRSIQPATPSDPVAAVTYDTPYAVLQHERMDYRHTTYQHPEAQAKYLESPLKANAGELQKIIQMQVTRALS